jgi:hypothetical protein
LGGLDHTPQQLRPWRQIFIRVCPPDSPHQAPGTVRIEAVPLEALGNDFLVALGTILPPCGHPLLNLFRILGMSFRQEVAA